MFGQVEEVAAAQSRLVAVAFGQLVVGAVSLQGLSGNVSAELFIIDQRRVTVVFERRAELGSELALQQQAWAF